MAVEYGTIGIRPRGEWDPGTKYDLLNLVVYDGSSYVAHTAPPKGTLPTDTAYWQVSAQGTGKATADSVGTVKPDGTTTEVNTDGVLSAKQATQTTSGIVKGSDGITVGEEGSIVVNTQFTQAAELANIIAGEAIAEVLGKVSKSIATTMNLDQNALLKNMLTSIDVNDSNKVPNSALIHTLIERIGMGTELTAEANLTAAFNALNSDLAVNYGMVDLTSTVATTGTMYYQNVGKNANLSFAGLRLANDFQNGTWVTIFTLDNYGRPVVPTRSAMVCSGTALYLNVETSGEIIISNYSGTTFVAGSVFEGQASYVIA